MSTTSRITVALAAAALLAAPASGQDRARAPGWIGISFDVTRDRRGWDGRVVITDVHRGSPAAAAGIRAGDRLLAVNDLDRPSELRELAERLRLRVGDRVRMVVERDGRRHDLVMRAGARPRDFAVSERVELSFEPDSMVETMMRSMDSLEFRLVQGQRGDIRVRTDAGAGTVVVTSDGRQVRAPFEFFVYRGAQHDSLREVMDEINDVAGELHRRLELRERVLERRFGRVSPMRFAQDDEVRQIRREIDEVSRRSAELQAAMADAARSTAGFAHSRSSAPAPRPDARVAGAESRREFRPLTPYLLGRNRVAGAEVVDIPPELAAYFRGVDDGVLVVDVAPRTPAAMSGIVPGDVITRLDQVVVRSVEDLRFGVSQAGETLPLTLVRQGSAVQVLLRR